MLEKFCLALQVTGASYERGCEVIPRGVFSNFEDYLQDECTQDISAYYIAARNTDDFKSFCVKVITP